MEISLMLHEGVIVNLEEEARALIAWLRRPVFVTPSLSLLATGLQLTGPSQPILTPHHRRIGSCKLHNWSIKGQESGLEFLVFTHYGRPVICGGTNSFFLFFLFLYKIEILFLSNLSVYVYKVSSWKLEPRPLLPYPTSTCEVTIITRVYGGVAGQILNKDNQVKGLPIEFKYDYASLNALILCLRTIFGIG